MVSAAAFEESTTTKAEVYFMLQTIIKAHGGQKRAVKRKTTHSRKQGLKRGVVNNPVNYISAEIETLDWSLLGKGENNTKTSVGGSSSVDVFFSGSFGHSTSIQPVQRSIVL
ncbi:MAG: hypothetical protein NWF00_01040 [Candidatus Bathyarchaeota archaeon]|nr:hypothetical protein [Candidatus Bathyarchaeota archaeon]